MRLFRSTLLVMLAASALPMAVLGWILFVETRGDLSRGGTTVAAGHLVRPVAYASLLAVVAAVALSAWFAHRLARPVAECVRGALDVARGRFGQQVAVTARNEVGELAYAFNHMSRELARYDAENRRLIAALERGYLDTLRSLASAIDAKDPSTHGHSQRVADLSLAIGRELGLDARRLEALAYGGLLHDIGKIGVPGAILHKAEALSESELAQMRAHPVIGADILRGVEFLGDAAPAVRSHHERWDGTGYPDRLAGEAIPLVARIVNAADTFDACTWPRPYQATMSAQEALEVVARLRCKQVDPAVCDALDHVIRRGVAGTPDTTPGEEPRPVARGQEALPR